MTDIVFEQKKHRGSTLLEMHTKDIDKRKKKGDGDAPPPIWEYVTCYQALF